MARKVNNGENGKSRKGLIGLLVGAGVAALGGAAAAWLLKPEPEEYIENDEFDVDADGINADMNEAE